MVRSHPGEPTRDKMKTVIEDTPTYTLTAEKREAINPAGLFELRIMRRWKQSEDPSYEHREFSVLLDNEGLQKLKDFL